MGHPRVEASRAGPAVGILGAPGRQGLRPHELSPHWTLAAAGLLPRAVKSHQDAGGQHRPRGRRKTSSQTPDSHGRNGGSGPLDAPPPQFPEPLATVTIPGDSGRCLNLRVTFTDPTATQDATPETD